ncbi:MAG: hypothetical protein GX352_01950 [Clostridiales bacterium]|nr:hypothetical protein [Clostridiales bacterium]
MSTSKRQEMGKWLDKGLCGLVPVYGEDGANCTGLLFREHPPAMTKIKVHTFITRLAAFFQKDIRLVREQAREITGQRSMNPLPINAHIILVPFKMRKPIGKDDGAVGYFFSDMIHDVTEDGDKVKVALKGGQKFQIIDTYHTAKRHISSAHQICFKLRPYDMGSPEYSSVCREYTGSYGLPATKGDILNLSRNIGVLVHKLDKLKI